MTGQRSDFLRVFCTRRDYCAALLELSREQQALIAADDYTQLLVLLGHKQGILGRMEEFNRRQPALWSRWREERGRLDPGDRAACESMLAETEAILATLYSQEQESTEDLARRRLATREELQNVSQGARAQSAYHDSPFALSSRLDIGQ